MGKIYIPHFRLHVMSHGILVADNFWITGLGIEPYTAIGNVAHRHEGWEPYYPNWCWVWSRLGGSARARTKCLLVAGVIVAAVFGIDTLSRDSSGSTFEYSFKQMIQQKRTERIRPEFEIVALKSPITESDHSILPQSQSPLLLSYGPSPSSGWKTREGKGERAP